MINFNLIKETEEEQKEIQKSFEDLQNQQNKIIRKTYFLTLFILEEISKHPEIDIIKYNISNLATAGYSCQIYHKNMPIPNPILGIQKKLMVVSPYQEKLFNNITNLIIYCVRSIEDVFETDNQNFFNNVLLFKDGKLDFETPLKKEKIPLFEEFLCFKNNIALMSSLKKDNKNNQIKI